MHKFFCAALVVLFSFGVCVPSALADEKPAAEKAVAHAVIQIGEEFEVVESAKLKDHKKEHDAAFKEATKSWEAAKKAAQKSKEKFTTPKPKPVPYKVIAPNLKSREAAEAQAKHLKEELEKEKERQRKAKEAKEKKK